jgi:hypothetical protein
MYSCSTLEIKTPVYTMHPVVGRRKENREDDVKSKKAWLDMQGTTKGVTGKSEGDSIALKNAQQANLSIKPGLNAMPVKTAPSSNSEWFRVERTTPRFQNALQTHSCSLC